MVNAAKESEQAFHTRINQAYILLISMALLVALPVAFLSKPVIHLIFGQVYDPSVGVLQIHIFSCLFIFLGSVSNRWLVIRKQQRYWMINSGLGALANILLNLWMIPKWGIQGAAWATLISYAFAYYFAYALFPRTRHIFSSQSANFFRVLTILPAWREIKNCSKGFDQKKVFSQRGCNIGRRERQVKINLARFPGTHLTYTRISCVRMSHTFAGAFRAIFPAGTNQRTASTGSICAHKIFQVKW